MKRLEIVHLRAPGEWLETLARRIKLSLMGEKPRPEAITVLRRDGLETDLAVHIRHLAGSETSGRSELGLQIASALRAYGLVEHTVWEELKGTGDDNGFS